MARMEIPFAKLPFIKQTFGEKISLGEGSFLECLYSTVQVYVDPSKNMCRLNVPRWRHLEELNLRNISHQYFKQQQLQNMAQRDNIKYLSKAPICGGKSRIGGGLLNSGFGKQMTTPTSVTSTDHH